jgi:hypothetical protein
MANVYVSQGALEIGTAITHKLFDSLTIEGCLSFLHRQSASLYLYYSPSKYLNIELDYESGFNSNTTKKFIPYGCLTSKWNLKATDSTSLNGEYSFDLDENSSEMSFGFETTAYENSAVKSQIDSEGDVKTEVQYTWSENLKFMASTKFSVENIGIPSESEFGLGCEYTC